MLKKGTDDIKKRKIKKSVIGIGLLIIFLGIFVLFYNGSIKNVSMEGAMYYTEKELSDKVMDSMITRNALGLYLTYCFGKNKEIPFVEKIDVKMSSWNSVKIRVYEKTMIACIKYMGEYLYFDKEGVVVESTTKQIDEIPLVEGVSFQKMNLYEKLEVKEGGIFEKILGISQLLSKYKLDIDKVVFEYDKSVTLYSGKIRVKLGKKERYDEQIAELSKLLPKAKKRNLKGVLDMEHFVEGQHQVIFQIEK